MSIPSYMEFDDSEYSALRLSLIRRSAKGSSVQREFLNRVRVSSEFVAYMKSAAKIKGDIDLDLLSEPMSESEFKDPPKDTEQRIFAAWQGLTPKTACRPTFWALVTCRHIENGRIESSYLAANGGTQAGGTERIDAVLKATGPDAPNNIDGCVRAVLRRLGGLPDRGNRSVYVNCPLARAWWRERLVAESAKGDPELEDAVRLVVRVSQQYWENLVTFVVSRNSVFGSPAVRNAFVRTLGAELATDPTSPLRSAKELSRACRILSAIQASRELSVMQPDEVEKIMLDVVGMAARQRKDFTSDAS